MQCYGYAKKVTQTPALQWILENMPAVQLQYNA
jgi:hypothetical protein